MKPLNNIVNNKEELKKVFESNSKLQKMIEEDFLETQLDIISEDYLYYIKGSLDDYSISSDIFSNYLKVNYSSIQEFLQGCKNIQEDYCLFEDPTESSYYTDLINTTLELQEQYIESNYNIDLELKIDLKLKIEKNTEEIKDKLLKVINSFFKYDSEEIFEYFYEFYTEARMNIKLYFYDESSYELFKLTSLR